MRGVKSRINCTKRPIDIIFRGEKLTLEETTEKYLLTLALPFALASCAGGRGGEEAGEDVVKSREEMSKAPASDAAVSNAEARLGASGVIFVDVEIDHEAAAAGGISALATGITPEMLAEAPHPVQFRVTIPALEGRYWWGEYDKDTGSWVGIATHAKAPHPDLEPYFDEAAGTYVVALPVEG